MGSKVSFLPNPKNFMNSSPDFAAHGYQVIKELGHNLEGGRFTYLAKRFADHVDVVVKQFQFSKGAGWDGFKAIEREMQSLQGLNHRGIPKYLDKFETDTGYCLVTEYFPADTLAVRRSFTPDQIKQVAVELLEILVYLQERMPPIIHRDVKPENILVDDALNVYLIDFGFARVGSGSVAMSSANAGTFGFMAPEQIRNLKLTSASDLYGLGLTLICLIGAIGSTDIGNYIDFSNQLDRSKIDPKLKGCSLTFVKWLDQMVAPDPSKRFAAAAIALKALKPLYVLRVPEVKFFKDGVEFDPSKDVLEFKATKIGEKLTQTITIVNPIPETVLEGHWEVAPHPNDPPHSPDNHAWIFFSRKKFEGNRVDCGIAVDTSKLIAQEKGRRNINLYLNTAGGKYNLAITVKTALLPIITNRFSFRLITELLIFLFLTSSLALSSILALSQSIVENTLPVIIGISMVIGVSTIAAWRIVRSATVKAKIGVFLLTSYISYSVFWGVWILWGYKNYNGFVSGISISIVTFILGCITFNEDYKNRFPLFVTILMGWALGCIYLLSADISWLTNFVKNDLDVSQIRSWLSAYSPYIYGATIASVSCLGYLLFYPSIEHQRKIADYRRKEEHLIKP
jgi:serine/threonine protein kinase